MYSDRNNGNSQYRYIPCSLYSQTVLIGVLEAGINVCIPIWVGPGKIYQGHSIRLKSGSKYLPSFNGGFQIHKIKS